MVGFDNNLIFKIIRFSATKIFASILRSNKTKCWCYFMCISTRVISSQYVYCSKYSSSERLLFSS
jgi:hypothetical protein